MSNAFETDTKTALMLEELRKTYQVPTPVATIKRALALAIVMSKHADEDGVIHLLSGKNGNEVLIPQRY